MVSRIWTAITSASSARIILKLLGLPGSIRLPLQLLFSAKTLKCTGCNISIANEYNSQYQLEKVCDWAFDLEHFQSILIEFVPAAAPTESSMVRYFEEDLKPSIKAEMDQDDIHLNNYKELVAKAVRAEAKTSLRPSSYMRETDLLVHRGSRPAYTTAHKVQTQEAVNCGDESRVKGHASSSASTFTQDSEPFDKAKRDKKQKQHKDKKNSRKSRNSFTPATEINKAEIGGKKKKDISKIIC